MFMPVGIVQQARQHGTVLFYDTFTDSDSTALDSHTPDIDLSATGWTLSSAVWSISSNQAVMTSNSTTNRTAITDPGQGNVIIEWYGNFEEAQFNSMGAAIRFQDATHYIACSIWTFSTNPWTWSIFSYNGGAPTSLASAQGSTSTGSVSGLYNKITISGDDIRWQVPGEGIDLNVNTAFLNTETRVGMRAYKQTSSGIACAADNFKITDNS